MHLFKMATAILFTATVTLACSSNLGPAPIQKVESPSMGNGSQTPLSVSLNGGSSGAPVFPGGAMALTAKLSANSNISSALMKIYVYSGNTQLWSQNFSLQNISTASKDFVQSFATPETLPPGTYSVFAEVLSADSSQILMARSLVANFAVQAPVRVAVGRTSPYVDSAGQVWSVDTGYISGLTFAETRPADAVAGTNDPELYRSFRWGQTPDRSLPQTITFTSPVPSAGRYKVKLKWMEHWVSAPGARLFNIVINGQTQVANFDLFVAAGGMFIAYDRSFVIDVPAGSLQVRVDLVPGPIENPKINAIEILGAP